MDDFPECPVAKVMTYRPLTIRRATTLAEVGRIFTERHVDCLPVAEDGALVGIVTKPAVLQALVFEEETRGPGTTPMERPVEAVMTRPVVTVGPETKLSQALQIMAETRCKSLPVTIGALLIGIVARGDVLRALRAAATTDLGVAREVTEPQPRTR
jgi:CBS domain-containing protein